MKIGKEEYDLGEDEELYKIIIPYFDRYCQTRDALESIKCTNSYQADLVKKALKTLARLHDIFCDIGEDINLSHNVPNY